MSKENVLFIGATAALVQETAQLFAKDGSRLILLGRSKDKLETMAADLKTKWEAQVLVYAEDFARAQAPHRQLIERIVADAGPIDVVVIAHGMLAGQKELEGNIAKIEELYQVNFLSVVSFLEIFAEDMEKRGKGTLAVLSSVAGDRGRQSNYIYGASKAALNAYLQGLRNRLYPAHVHVLTVKPGLVATPMTAHLKKELLCTEPKPVGRDIYNAIRSRKNILYTPWYWRWIMGLVKSIPEPVFKRLKL